MYETNFGFHRQPFQCADLTRAFFISESIRSILPQLLHALRSDLGIAVLTGPAGVGKTSLLKHLQLQLAHEGRAVLCSAAGLETPTEVLQTLQAASLLKAGTSSSESTSSVAVRNRWTVVEQMRKTTEFWGPILLLIDDAQLLSVPVLNELRAFTEEEWNGRALVRSLIAGPLNLEEELARPAHADFSRRIRCHAFLEPLTSKESLECLNRHLSVVGGKLKDVFTPQALDLIAVASDGLPRCLTLLADESLVVAAERSAKVADEDCVRTALTRLQHLAYAWNTSPMVSDHQSSLMEAVPESSASTPSSKTSQTSATLTQLAAGVFEFGAPGIVDPGQKSASARMTSQPTVATFNAAEITDSELSGTIDAPEDHATVAKTPSNSGTFEFGSASAQSFEVGHRYQPDALEASDAVEMDSFGSTPFADEVLVSHDADELYCGVSSYEYASEFDASAAPSTLGMPTAQFDAPPQLAADERNSETDLELIETASTVASPPIHFISNSAGTSDISEAISVFGRTQEPIFRNAIGDELSSRLPVFDRYTWIALGREVPSGTYAVSSTLEMQRGSENELGAYDQWLTKESLENAIAFDKIPVRRTSDAEILMMLKSHQSASAQGEFVTFRPAPFLGQGLRTTPERLNSEFAETTNPLTMNQGSNAEQYVDPSDVTESAVVIDIIPEITPPADDNVLSEANRQLIQNAIRVSLPANLAEPAPSRPVVNVFDITDSPSISDVPLDSVYPGITEQLQFKEWHDGQLIFNSVSAEHPETSVPVPAADATPESVRISLNFEAARLARDGQALHTRDVVGVGHREPEHPATRFFSLPNEVRTIEWDLRDDTLSTDDAGSFADTLSSLRDEVTTFQRTGRLTSVDDGQQIPPSYEFSESKHDAAPEQLTTIARNRIEPIPREESTLASAFSAISEAAILAKPAPLTFGPESSIVPAETKIAQEATSFQADNRPPAGAEEPGDFSPRYSQLFTKLRQVRSRATGNR